MSLYKERIGLNNQFSLVVFVLRMKGGNRTNPNSGGKMINFYMSQFQ